MRNRCDVMNLIKILTRRHDGTKSLFENDAGLAGERGGADGKTRRRSIFRQSVTEEQRSHRPRPAARRPSSTFQTGSKETRSLTAPVRPGGLPLRVCLKTRFWVEQATGLLRRATSPPLCSAASCRRERAGSPFHPIFKPALSSTLSILG